MARNRLRMQTNGFKEMFEKLDKANADVKKIAEEALKKTFDAVTPGIAAAIQAHKDTGVTEDSLTKEAVIEWQGNTAKVPVGFNIKEGGLPSIFLMYGTPKHMVSNQYGKTGKSQGGTAQDMTLYNSIYGTSTRRKVKDAQEGVLKEEMGRIFG